MTRRILILNIGLMVLLGFGAVRFREQWNSFNSTHQVSAVKPRTETLPGLPVGNAQAPNTMDWTAIASHNPFSFDRSDITVAAPAEPAAPPKPVGPKPVLFGTVIIGANRLAVLGSGQNGGTRNSRPVKTGEVIDGWTVVQIDDNSVAIEANSIRETVLINDPSSQFRGIIRGLLRAPTRSRSRPLSAGPRRRSHSYPRRPLLWEERAEHRKLLLQRDRYCPMDRG